ncbi:flagellar motor switch protein FliN [Rhizobium sp. KVB221]|uniref:Flagellar motor switch protein FliN n=1 Tax=Rhizobium setariae TaxID=2801340 RepID=A0A936YJD0_9HYPH|nr:flagellar motor switch protein FliN [Rhizobium setariae]MBL0370668.1 flagellar motor switch protein FliN [Rhizobium setariae]
MAPKKAKAAEAEMAFGDENAEFDQAIDDLRGVLKADADGLPAVNDFGSEFSAETGDTGFSSDFGFDAGSSDSDFGAASGLSTDFGGESFGGSDFGGSDFATSSFGESSGESMQMAGSAMHANHDMIMNIPIDVQIILGSSRMQVSGLMNLNEGAIISLDRKIGEPVDLVVNGRLIGRGEICVLENDETRFGIKLIEVKSVGKPQ